MEHFPPSKNPARNPRRNLPKNPAIIAIKGLPCTFKTGVATSISCWAGSPVLFVDDFLDKLSTRQGGGGNGYSDSSPPSGEEAERLLCLAFDTLCNVADNMLGRCNSLNCLVIESRFCFKFELDRLFSLAHPCSSPTSRRVHPLIIIECQMRNRFQWQKHFESDHYQRSISGHLYKPKDWNEVEDAKDGYDAYDWDCHFDQKVKQLPQKKQHLVTRLVLDPYNDLNVNERKGFTITNPFVDAIKYLLTAGNELRRKFPPVVEFDELRHFCREQLRQSNASKERSKYLCANGGCEFEYWEALEKEATRCWGVCDGKLVSGPGYACRFCSLALHKSCAEDIKISVSAYKDRLPRPGAKVKTSDCYNFSSTRHACESCRSTGKDFSYECHSCIFQTHLKCQLLPTVIYHDSHPKHFLFIRLSSKVVEDHNYGCKACGCHGYLNSYVCKVCNCNYHIKCLALPQRVEHKHGGYKHRMKLMYSLNKEQDDFWCDVCYRDMDPYLWFYSCQDCDYVVHMNCVRKKVD